MRHLVFLLLAFVVCSKSIQPNLGSTGSSKSEYRYEREDRGSSLPSKEDSEPLGTSSSAASSPIQDPAATLEEREEKKSSVGSSAFSTPSPDINGNFIRHSRGLTSNKGDMTKTSESREGHNVAAPTRNLDQERPSFGDHEKRNFHQSRFDMLSEGGHRDSLSGYDFRDDEDNFPSANDIAQSVGMNSPNDHRNEGPPRNTAGSAGFSSFGASNPPHSGTAGSMGIPGARGGPSGTNQGHAAQSQQGGSRVGSMGNIDDTMVHNMPNKQQLYGNNDLSQVDKDYIFEGLRRLYQNKVLPLEMASKYSNFASPPMSHSDFEAKPMVLIIGQYSVGKTSFIRSLVKQDFPGQRIGPEPTTDRFTAIMHSNSRSHLQQYQHQQKSSSEESDSRAGTGHGRLIPGHALVMESDKPFAGLGSMGNNFLSKFEGAEIDAAILRNITIIDTPGVLAGEKQRIGRDYDFSEVIKWFAERADMIIVMFDGHKLDISDELKTVLDVLKPHQEKLRVLLNKADSIDTQSLLRVYGALMWSLGKVVQTPEACRIYLGSFWDGPLKLQDNKALLEREKSDLLTEMSCLPANAVIRRINELVKRARSVKVHAYIIHYLKKQMPYLVGKSEKQARLLERLDREFVACARRYNLPLGDFPNVDQYRKMLAEVKDISDFKKLDKRLVVEMDRVLTHDIPLLLQKAQQRRKPSRMVADRPNGNSFGGRVPVRKQHDQYHHQQQHQQYNQQYHHGGR